MATEDVLSQDEIDSLLYGAEEGAIPEGDDMEPSGEPKPFSFENQEKVLRGRLPGLEMINERFARTFRIGLFNLLRRSPEVTSLGVEMHKFEDYLNRLVVPTSLNMVKARPLRGTSLCILDPNLVFVLVDNFFGGDGRYHSKVEGREFTMTELQTVRTVLEQAFVDLKDAWAPIMDVDFEHLGSEVNPRFANIVSPSEIVVVNRFYVELEGGGGDFHITIPYTNIEPIREQLKSGVQGSRHDVDERWRRSLQEEVRRAEVELSSTLLNMQLPLREIQKLSPGDILPCDLPEQVTVRSEGIPLFKARYGQSNGHAALKITGPISDADNGE